VQVLTGIERSVQVRVLESKPMGERERIQIIGPDECREIADPEIEIGRNIRKSTQHQIVLQEKLSIYRRIAIGFKI
jgi:hypothetical protein